MTRLLLLVLLNSSSLLYPSAVSFVFPIRTKAVFDLMDAPHPHCGLIQVKRHSMGVDQLDLTFCSLLHLTRNIIRFDGFSFCWDFVLTGFRSHGLNRWSRLPGGSCMCLERSALLGQSKDFTAVVSPGCQNDSVCCRLCHRVVIVIFAKCPCNVYVWSWGSL